MIRATKLVWGNVSDRKISHEVDSGFLLRVVLAEQSTVATRRCLPQNEWGKLFSCKVSIFVVNNPSETPYHAVERSHPMQRILPNRDVLADSRTPVT